MPKPSNKPIDLVLAGGGVKGIGLVGAVVKLMEAGYRAYRVAGSSAGSIVGALVAAAAKDDQMTPQEIRDLALEHRLPKFTDRGRSSGCPFWGRRGRSLQGSGIYKGDYARTFVADQLENLGVRTFGDLKLDDDELPEERRYRLVVTQPT